VALLVTFVISVGAIVQRNHVTIGLVILNYTLLADAIGIVIIGSFVWFYTLRERANFHVMWAEATPAVRITIQDHVRLCPASTYPLFSNWPPVQMLWLLQWH
jgi:hypothetical protein